MAENESLNHRPRPGTVLQMKMPYLRQGRYRMGREMPLNHELPPLSFLSFPGLSLLLPLVSSST